MQKQLTLLKKHTHKEIELREEALADMRQIIAQIRKRLQRKEKASFQKKKEEVKKLVEENKDNPSQSV